MKGLLSVQRGKRPQYLGDTDLCGHILPPSLLYDSGFSLMLCSSGLALAIHDGWCHRST